MWRAFPSARYKQPPAKPVSSPAREPYKTVPNNGGGMAEERKCNQEGCEATPEYRYTWPGKDEKCICQEHAEKVLAIAGAMGMHLQMIPLEP